MINNYLERQIKENFPYELTFEQNKTVELLSVFLLSGKKDTVFVLRGFAGTGKTDRSFGKSDDCLAAKSSFAGSYRESRKGIFWVCRTSGLYHT